MAQLWVPCRRDTTLLQREQALGQYRHSKLFQHTICVLQVTTPTQQLAKSSNGRGGGPAPESENVVAEVLENTLWNRQLGVMSEEIVAALVCQIFEGMPILLSEIPAIC